MHSGTADNWGQYNFKVVKLNRNCGGRERYLVYLDRQLANYCPWELVLLVR